MQRRAFASADVGSAARRAHARPRFATCVMEYGQAWMEAREAAKAAPEAPLANVLDADLCMAAWVGRLVPSCWRCRGV